MQILLVAFSRRMCCSRVWSANRRAGRPAVSVLTPTSRPGSVRAYDSLAARNAACGPPKPIGTPKRWALPTAISKPSEPGVVSSVLASASTTHTLAPPRTLAAVTMARTVESSATRPLDDGRETTTQKASMATKSASGAVTTVMPSGSQRVCSTARCCG